MATSSNRRCALSGCAAVLALAACDGRGFWCSDDGATCCYPFHVCCSFRFGGCVVGGDLAICESDDWCADGNPCTTDECIGQLCSFTPRTGSCDDGDSCTTGDTCVDGTCQGTLDSELSLCHPCVDDSQCNDGNLCTIDSCVDGSCFSLPLDSVPCGVGDVCNGAQHCIEGICQTTVPLDCDDGDPCTDDSCDPTWGCQNVRNGLCGG